MQCYWHKKEETFVSCGKCERPICPKCMVQGPAGLRCRECASLRSTALYQVPPGRLVLAAAAGLVVGVVGAGVVSMLSFFTLFAAPVYGGLVAEAVKRASGHKRGPMLEAIAVGSVVIGYLVAALPYVFMLSMANSPVAGGPSAAAATHAMFGGLALTIMWRLLGLALAVSACWGRMKYF